MLMCLPMCAHSQERPDSGSANLVACKKAADLATDNWREGFCSGVIMATFSTLSAAKIICNPPGASFNQGFRVVIAYMDRHPEFLHKPLTGLAIDALVEAFPCAH
jgi:hypothetical protein